MERPSYENMLESIKTLDERKRYNVIELLANTEQKQIVVKTNPEFVNIIKRFTLNNLIEEVDTKLNEMNFQGKEENEKVLTVFLEKEDGEYRISIEANEAFEKELEFFKKIETIMQEIIVLLEEKVKDYQTSDGVTLETKSYKMVFDKEYNILNGEEVEKEYDRLKEKYSFRKNMQVLQQIFNKEECDFIEFVYQTDEHIEWNETFYTYKKNQKQEN